MEPDNNNDLPPELVDILLQFSIAVLKAKPANIITFGAKYFTELSNTQNKPTVHKTVMLKNVTPTNKIVTVGIKPQHSEASETDSVFSFDIQDLTTHKSLKTRRPSVAAERYNPEDDEEDENDEETEPSEVMVKSEEQKIMLLDVCKKNTIFASRDDETILKIIDVMKCRPVESGETIIEQDDDGDNFYVIESGIYDAIKSDINGEETCVYTYYNEGSFGELALIYNAPRSASVIARTSGKLWYITRKHFQKLILSHASKQRFKFLDLLHSVKMFHELSPDERMNIADALRTRKYKDNECIIRQGDPGYEIYFIMEGNVIVKREDKNGVESVICELGKGSYFGELALLVRKPRAASVYARGSVTTAYLDVDSFERLLGPCVHIMRRNTSTYGSYSKLLDNEDISDI
ncbi:unnamed protein product [Trichobilharzia szidati]|nr:unnamed protein product [Trichobilharzia szidati]